MLRSWCCWVVKVDVETLIQRNILKEVRQSESQKPGRKCIMENGCLGSPYVIMEKGKLMVVPYLSKYHMPPKRWALQFRKTVIWIKYWRPNNMLTSVAFFLATEAYYEIMHKFSWRLLNDILVNSVISFWENAREENWAFII